MEGRGRGKRFEEIIHETLERSGFVVERIKDQMSMFKGSTNGYDFIAYKHPLIYFLECKSIKGNRLPINTVHFKRQLASLLNRAENVGVIAGFIVWFVDHDLTMFFDARYVEAVLNSGRKSLNCEDKGQIFAGERLRQYFKYGDIYTIQQGGYFPKK